MHLDIKLENILISASGKYKIGDLGLSRLISKLHSDFPEGDCRYIAMELLNKDDTAPLPDMKKADNFSLGILAFELVERRRVLPNGPEWHALREGRISFTCPDSVSPEMQKLVRWMLSEKPEDRPSTSDLLTSYLMSDKDKEIKMLRQVTKSLLKKYLADFLASKTANKDFPNDTN